LNVKNTMRPAGHDEPQADGERLVSWLRLALAFISICLIGAYTFTTAEVVWRSLLLAGVAMVAWSAMSGGYLLVLRRGLYRPWMSFLSTAVDIMVVTLVQLSFLVVLPLNFVNGPITSIYFVTIGLAAIRKSRRLAVFSGMTCAVVHLALSGVCFLEHLPAGYLLTEINGFPMEITYLDEVGIALCLAFTGWTIGHVTRGLRESERHYQELFENVPDGILIASSRKLILAVNRRLSDMTGVPVSELIGARVDDYLNHGISERSPTPVTLCLIGSPTSLVCRDGTSIPVRTVTSPISYNGEPCVEMSVRDVAEQARLERQLAQSQKMETIGKLAGGLAHDFNNILGGILGAASLARRTLSRSEPGENTERLRKQVDIIQECGERARDVVTRLLTFSRKTVIEAEPVDLNALARDVAAICSNTFGPGVVIRIDGTPEPLLVEGDSTSLTQALLNLCINGRDAIRGEGTLTIRVAQADPDDEALARHPAADTTEEYCMIQVSDTGTGIEEHLLSKIFDPFFTTKPPGEGTGLGLSMVYNIARQHGGFVDVQSTPGAGSSFSMFLTRARVSLLPPEPDEADLPKGNGRILLVDDDKIVRATVQGMLSELGYEVVTAPDGVEGMRLFSAASPPFDLVLLDMVMPHIDGTETLRRIRKLDTRVKVIITSGYVDVGSTAGLSELGYSDFLNKPFTFAILARMVHRILGRPSGPSSS